MCNWLLTKQEYLRSENPCVCGLLTVFLGATLCGNWHFRVRMDELIIFAVPTFQSCKFLCKKAIFSTWTSLFVFYNLPLVTAASWHMRIK